MRENISLPGRLAARSFQRYWRLTRGLLLSAEVCVFDAAGRALMLRDEVAGDWRLPKGTVRQGETLEMAATRVVCDMAAIEVRATPELFCFYAEGKDRQIALYIVRHWRRLSAEVARESKFLGVGSLPPGVTRNTAERICRLAEDPTISEV